MKDWAKPAAILLIVIAIAIALAIILPRYGVHATNGYP